MPRLHSDLFNLHLSKIALGRVIRYTRECPQLPKEYWIIHIRYVINIITPYSCVVHNYLFILRFTCILSIIATAISKYIYVAL